MKTILICAIAITSLASLQSNKNNYTNTDPLQESIVRGSEIYEDFCMDCHLPTGMGVSGVFPPLAKSDFLKSKREESIKAIKYGLQGPITVNGEMYNATMSSLGLSDDEIADVMNYITNTWGNKNDKIITTDEVAKLKK